MHEPNEIPKKVEEGGIEKKEKKRGEYVRWKLPSRIKAITFSSSVASCLLASGNDRFRLDKHGASETIVTKKHVTTSCASWFNWNKHRNSL
jgi:hypothetical protein